MVSQDASSYSQNTSNVSMCQKYVSVATRNKVCGNLNPSTRKATDQPSSSTPPTYGPLPIDKTALELKSKPPKGMIRKLSFIPHVRELHKTII